MDEQGWDEIGEILANLEEQFRAVGEGCAARLRTADEGFPIVFAVAAFEAADRGA